LPQNCSARAPLASRRAPARSLVGVLAGVLAATLAMPSLGQTLREAAGGTDSPVLSRFQGSVLYAYGDESFGAAKAVEADKGKPVLRAAEGRVANRFYWSPAGASALEIQRNYLAALKKAGYQIVYACDVQKCIQDQAQQLVARFPETATWKNADPMVLGIFDSGNQNDFTLVSAQKSAGAGAGVVRVLVATSSADLGPPYQGRVRQLVQVIEPAAVKTGKVTVDAGAIGDTLKRDGKIALYGVLFDTNKAVLRPDSDDQLAQMAKALAAAPALKVFIVGHTDNQGDFAANIDLSQRRAQAVLEALAGRYKIAANRMIARGVANLAPVASNANDDSRARNRRVELVLR